MILVEHSGNLVSKDEILTSVWPKTIVDEANLSVQISSLRRVLDQGRSGNSCIQTVAGRGYRFVLDVVHEAEALSELCTPRQTSRPAVRSRRSNTQAVVAGAIVLVASLVILGWSVLRDRTVPSFGPTVTSTQGFDRRQSVIVLPFESNSGDPAHDDLAAALTRDLTDRIALGNFPVVPAVTASGYRGTSVDLQVIGRRHDVHFALGPVINQPISVGVRHPHTVLSR